MKSFVFSGPTKQQQQKNGSATMSTSTGSSSCGGRWQMKTRNSVDDPVPVGTSDPLDVTSSMHMDALSLPQLVKLRKFAYLKLTALLERYSPTAASRGASGRNWGGVHKLIKKIKSPDAKAAKGTCNCHLCVIYSTPLIG